MTKAKLVRHTREDLLARRDRILTDAGRSASELRVLVQSGRACCHEVDAWRELDGVAFLLGEKP